MKYDADRLVGIVKPEWSCGCSELKVKGKDAYLDDFGEMADFDPENAPDYGCGDRGFAPVPSVPEVLEKYDLTIEEYDKICEFLADELHIGTCGLCS